MNYKLLIAIVALLSVLTNVYFAQKLMRADRVITSQSAPIDQIEVIRTSGGLLQVSSIKSPETFDATKFHTILGLDVGPTTTQIRVPAVFNYQIELAPEWKATVKDKVFIVVAPAVKPSLPVAIDTSRLERFSSGRWSFFTGTAELDALQKAITPELAKRAASSSYVSFQREAARETVREFVVKWQLSQARWSSSSGYSVKVFFADEPIQSLSAVSLPYVVVSP